VGALTSDPDASAPARREGLGRVIALRRLLGDVLRQQRVRQGRTLRQVSGDSRVSLGYISEIERGQKEASSEMLAALCGALDVPLSRVLREVSELLAVEESRAAGVEGRRLTLAAEPVAVPREATASGEVVAAA
jgi:transcriptional regulator with XRE-family HTH domain